jgi:hypothetical protein
MKKTVVLYFLFFVAIFLAPSIASAQADEVKNSTNRVITLQSLNKDSEITINPYKKGIVDFAGNGALECYLFYYIGQSEVSVGKIVKTLDNGKCEITAGDLSGVPDKSEKKITRKLEKETPAKELEKTDETSAKKSADLGEKKYIYQDQNANCPKTTITIADSSDYSFVVLSGQFSGLALSPMQTSEESYEVNTGQMQITIKHLTKKDKDPGTSGTVFKETVISKIITQGQKCLIIKNEDFPADNVEDVKIKMISLIPYEIVISAGPLKGTALGRGDVMRTEAKEGFNSLAIQYFGPDKHIVQADLQFIVRKNKTLKLRESGIKNIVIID